MTIFTGLVPTHHIECDRCGGAGRVTVYKLKGHRQCNACRGVCYVDVDMTIEERLERIETRLGLE